MFYRQLRRTVQDSQYQLVDAEQSQVGLCLANPKVDYYTSLFKYNHQQYTEFKVKKSIAGMRGVSDWCVFDFDSVEDPALAQKDALEVCKRLINNGVEAKALRIAFSSNKGFHVEVRLNQDLTVEELKTLTKNLAGDLPTFDTVIYDPARIFRVLGSFNPKSGLYKIPLTLSQLENESIDSIKELAATQDVFKGTPFEWSTIDLPDQLVVLKTKAPEKQKLEIVKTDDIDWSVKPKDFPACRWAIYNGLFKPGQRHSALMALVSFFKNRGEPKETAYHRGLGAIELQSKRNQCPELDKEEFYRTVVDSVYGPEWKNGQYSCREEDSWLANYCTSLGIHKCKHKDNEETFIEIDDFAAKFTNFAVNIDKNRLKFGIEDIDDRVMVTTGMLVGLLGAPSAGKTTLLLNFLEQTNRDQIDSVFFSMDMSLPLVYLRLIQKNFGYSKDKVFDIFLNNPKEMMNIIEMIKEKYKYTKFSFKTGLEVQGMRDSVQDHEQKIGRKVKLVGIDYLECIRGPYSDSTANSGLIGNQCKDMANDLETCAMLLLQTQKQSGDPSDPLLSMRNVKGSSVVEQACSVILSLSRPGFSPTSPDDDKYATISSVKDRMGSLMSVDVSWNGLRGEFGHLDDVGRAELNTLKGKLADKKQGEKDNRGWPS